MTNTRLHWIENLRAIACFLVIFLHVSNPYLNDVNKTGLINWTAILSMHSFARICVPIFLMITGALLLNKEYQYLSYYKFKMIKVIRPLLIWSIFYIIIFLLYNIYLGQHFTLNSIYSYSVNALIHGAAYHLWYMYVLIGIYLVLPFVANIKMRTPNIVAILFLLTWFLLLLFAQFSTNYIIELCRIILGYFGYVVLGSFLSQLEISKRIAIYISSLLIIIGMALTVYPVYSTYINSNIVPAKWFYYLNINIVLLSAGFFLLIKNIQFQSVIINKIAKYSFGIYFIHLFFIMMLNKLPDFFAFLPHAINAILITAVVLLLSFTTIYLLKKNPLLSTYIDS